MPQGLETNNEYMQLNPHITTCKVKKLIKAFLTNAIKIKALVVGSIRSLLI